MTAYYNENDPVAAESLRELMKEGLIAYGHVDDRSISEVQSSDLKGYTQCHFFAGIGGWSLALRLAGWHDQMPVWTGSCPCQPFSIAGKRTGVNDERHLWPEFERLIDSERPYVIFGEQVAGPDGILWAEQVSNDFDKKNYKNGFFVLPLYAFGAPQKRYRSYFVACNTITDATRWSADVWRNWRLQTMEANPWPSPPWQQGNAEYSLLVDGLPPNLVKSLLKGLGNAINPKITSEIIRAFVECKISEKQLL